MLLAIFGISAGAHARAQIAEVGDGSSGPVRAQHLTAQMVALGPAIAPGGTQQVGLALTLDKGWHVYWINPGDSGEPPKIAWIMPAGISAEAMQFPIPKRLPLGPLMDFGYEDEVAFPVTISAASTIKPGPVHLDAQVELAGVRAGLHSWQGPYGDRSDGADGSEAWSVSRPSG